jgi:RimJ/RimL family protein N-acetyltransferase
MIPTLLTPRLRLRAPALADFEAYAAFFASDRAVYEDGPLTREAAWAEFAIGAGGWVLRGFGSFSLEDRATGRYLGEAGIYQPSHYPEPEIGWILMAEAEGKGLAHEAALAVRGWAYGALGLPTLVSYIDARNARSIRLAERLGAVLDPTAPSCGPGALVYRHPAPEALGSAA